MSWQSVLQVSVGAAASVIQSIQQGSITISAASLTNTATVTSVDTSKAILIWNGLTSTNTTTSGAPGSVARIELTNATTVTATRGDSTLAITVRFTVVEFASGVNSIQAGTIALSVIQATNTATISSVGANAFVLWLGASTAVAGLGWTETQGAVELTNSTTVTATNLTGSTLTVGYMVVDLDTTIVSSVQKVAHTDATTNASYTETISSVTTGRTLLFYNGVVPLVTLPFGSGSLTQELTNATTITFTRASTTTTSRTSYLTVVEFAAAVITSLQRGTISLVSVTSNTATITGVVTAKTFVNWGNERGPTSGPANRSLAITLTNTTTVTAAVNTSTAGPTVGAYAAIEFV